jgi:hypothetical protein
MIWYPARRGSGCRDGPTVVARVVPRLYHREKYEGKGIVRSGFDFQ